MAPPLKTKLFEERYKKNLENPNMSLEEWLHVLYSKPTKITVEKIQHGKNRLGVKRFKYQITQDDPLWPNCQPAVRSKADFVMLQKQLDARFPTAVVPNLFREDDVFMLEMYLTEIAKNPFFRLDVAFVDFVDGKFKEYKQTKKKDRQQSEGTLRWLQQVTEYKEVDATEDYIKTLKNDFEQLERSQKSMVKAFQRQMKALSELQIAANVVSSSLGELSVMEQTSESKEPASIAGEPIGRVRATVGELMKLNKRHNEALSRSYDPEILKKVAVDPILYDLQTIASFRKLLDQLAAVKADFEKAEAAVAAGGDSKAEQVKNEKDIIFYKQRKAFAFELERFKTFRTVRFHDFFTDYVRFNIRGGEQVSTEWSSSGLTLDAQSEQEFHQRMRRHTQPDRARGMSLAQSQRNAVGATETVTLRVTNPQNGGALSKYAKVTKGELVAGHKIEGGDWYVTTSTGAKGLVKASNVAVQSMQATNHNTSSDRPSSARPPPGLGNTFDASGIPEAINTGGDDWSVSDGGQSRSKTSESPKPSNHRSPSPVPNTFSRESQATMSRPVPPGLPSMPPGLSASVKAPPGMPAMTQTFTQSYRAPPPDMRQSNRETGGGGGGFGAPVARPELPSFGAPSSEPPKMPSFQASMSRKAPPAQRSVTPPANSPPKPNLGRPGPGGMPPRSFLADIAAGKQNNKLKKVPDSEKSAEIGGNASTKKAVGGSGAGGSGGPPPGGVMGELAAKLRNRK